MKNKSFGFVFAVITAVLMLVQGIAVNAYTTADNFNGLAAETTEYKMKDCGFDDVQSFINGWITDNAGVNEADWYALCLSKEGGYDFSSYLRAIKNAVDSSSLNASERLRMAVVYNALGGEKLNLSEIADSSWNGLGIMSEIYSLILHSAAELSSAVTEDELIAAILARQFPDGGWALSGSRSDTDVTAMALQALAPYRDRADVSAAIDSALARLSQLQREDGGFASYGTQNAESCAQVIIALRCLDTDPCTDSRFLKNGLSAVDALLSYRCGSGGFSHIQGGRENYLATVQACMAFTALEYDETGLFEPNMQNIVIPAATTTAATKAPIVNTGGTAQESSGTESETEAVQTDSQMSETETTAAEISETTKGTTSARETVTTTSAVKTEPAEKDETGTKSEAVIGNTDETAAKADTDSRIGWKPYAIITICGVFAAAQLYFIARKQFSWKRLGISAVTAVVCVAAVMAVKIQTPEEYYRRNIDDVGPDSLTVTMSVSCETIKDELDGDYIIIPETEIVLLEGDTAFTVLERVLAYNKIPFDYNGASSAVYIKGIADIYEMDYGGMSGWMFTVNGEFPDTGCGSYEPSDGDVIEWLYTLDIGHDIGAEEYSE